MSKYQIWFGVQKDLQPPDIISKTILFYLRRPKSGYNLSIDFRHTT